MSQYLARVGDAVIATNTDGRIAFLNAVAQQLTGYGTQKDREQSQAAGFDEHIIKPVDFDRLRALLETLPNRSA